MSATATIRPFTVVAFDIDGNPHVFPVSAHDERSAELKLSLQDKEEFGPGMIVAVLPGELEMNPPEASTELEAWTVVGFWSDEPFQFVTDAYSAAEALITAPVGARFPCRMASPPDWRTGLSKVRITSVL